MLTVEFTFTPAGKFAGDAHIEVRILDVADNGDVALLSRDGEYLCDDCEYCADNEDFTEDWCEFAAKENLADYILCERGFERTSPYTFDDLQGFEQSADIRRVDYL